MRKTMQLLGRDILTPTPSDGDGDRYIIIKM
jgi:hypothetical protein